MLGVLFTIRLTQSLRGKELLGRIEELSIFVNISEQEMHFKQKIFNQQDVFSYFITRSRKLEIDVIRI